MPIYAVTPIDIASATAGPPITGFTYPLNIRITPDGSRAYISDSPGVTPMELPSHALDSPVSPVSTPVNGIAIAPDGSRAYVGGNAYYNEVDVAIPADTTNSVPGFIQAVGPVAFTPDSSKAYVCIPSAESVQPVDVATRTPGAQIILPGADPNPIAVAVEPTGTTAYVLDYNSGTLDPIDIATDTLGTAINVGSYPVYFVITPDGTTAWVMNVPPGFLTTSLVPVDLGTTTVGTPIPFTFGEPSNSWAITPDGAHLYIGDQTNGRVVPFDIASSTYGTPILVTGYPFDVAITPDGATAYVTRTVVPTATAPPWVLGHVAW